jgi:hypothetical protein
MDARKRESIVSEVAIRSLLFAEYAPSQFPQIFIGYKASKRCVIKKYLLKKIISIVER